MKRIILLPILLLIFPVAFSQTGSSDNQLIQQFIENIRNDRIRSLAKMVEYPIKRPNPLPDIEDETDFILYYPLLFDEEFKRKIIEDGMTDPFQRNGQIGLLSGGIWLNEEGKIITINYNPDAETALKKQLEEEVYQIMHKSVEPAMANALVCECEGFLIRIDEMEVKEESQYRYVSWGEDKTIAQKPDLILENGDMEFYGTMGGYGYTFRNGKWTYKVETVRLAESEDQEGTFLVVSEGENEVSRKKCTLTK